MARSWWFVRKHPCWRLRIAHGAGAAANDSPRWFGEVLDEAVSRSAVRRWSASSYEPETVAFGGPHGMDIAHDLFHADSIGIVEYLRRARVGQGTLLDAKTTSLLVTTLFLRAAGQEWSEQGDVWGRVEARRPLPDDVPAEHVTAMTGTLRKLLMADVRPRLMADGSLAEWIAGMERAGRALADAGREGRLSLGTRCILARHVIFHWNRMGFSTRQQAVWARAAREAILGG